MKNVRDYREKCLIRVEVLLEADEFWSGCSAFCDDVGRVYGIVEFQGDVSPLSFLLVEDSAFLFCCVVVICVPPGVSGDAKYSLEQE